MSAFESGLLVSTGPLVLVTQGLTGCRFVAGKQCHFRLLLPPGIVARVDRVLTHIVRPQALSTIAILSPQAYLSVDFQSPVGPSIGLIVRGHAFPRAGEYVVTLTAYDLSGAVLATAKLVADFAPSYDLRVFIVLLQGTARGFTPTPAWHADIDLGMRRLGTMLPVRDCVRNSLGGSRRQGLRYQIGANPKEAWPEEVGLKVTDAYYWDDLEAHESAAGPADDHVDVGVLFRPNQVGEVPGGHGDYCVTRPRAHVVGGALGAIQMTGPCVAHEVGHALCLEPKSSPWSDGGMHSTAALIADPFAYDFLNRRFFPAPGAQLGDVMGVGSWQGADSVAYSAYDWNHLAHQSLPNLQAAGRTGSETNPVLKDACPPIRPYRPLPDRPIPPEQWIPILGSRADGPHWIWTPHGPVPGPVPGKGRGGISPEIRSVIGILRSLKASHTSEMYLPMPAEPLTIATAFTPDLHGNQLPLPKFKKRGTSTPVARESARRAKRENKGGR